jgi:hypothetical protein
MTRSILLGVVGLLFALLALPGCKRKDPEACNSAQSTVRQALGSEDFESAKKWRDYAYKQCADPAQLSALDKEIIDKQSEVTQRKADEDAKKKRTDELVKLFVDWAGQHKADPAGAAVNVVCTPAADPKDEKKAKEHWCTRDRMAGEFKLGVTYWEAEPDTFEFATVAPGPVTCDDLGPNTVIKNGHDGALLHCNLTGGALAGLQALILRTAAGTTVSVVSPKYIDKNDAFKRKLAL